MNKISYEERARVYADALETFGGAVQLVVALEELSEAQKEICKALRGSINLTALAEEVADATIMLEQVRQIFGINGDVCSAMDYKVTRLQERIEAAKRVKEGETDERQGTKGTLKTPAAPVQRSEGRVEADRAGAGEGGGVHDSAQGAEPGRDAPKPRRR